AVIVMSFPYARHTRRMPALIALYCTSSSGAESDAILAMTGVNIAMSRSMLSTTVKGLTLMGECGPNPMNAPFALRHNFSKERPRSSRRTCALVARYDQAISFIHTDLPDPGVPMIAPLKL